MKEVIAESLAGMGQVFEEKGIRVETRLPESAGSRSRSRSAAAACASTFRQAGDTLSRPSGGACFSFTLPLERVAAAA